MIRYSELKCKEVINIRDGCKYGTVNDLEIEKGSGKIKAIIVPVSSKFLGLFANDEEYRILWKNIVCIGDDTILVDVCEDDYKDYCRNEHRREHRKDDWNESQSNNWTEYGYKNSFED